MITLNMQLLMFLSHRHAANMKASLEKLPAYMYMFVGYNNKLHFTYLFGYMSKVTEFQIM